HFQLRRFRNTAAIMKEARVKLSLELSEETHRGLEDVRRAENVADIATIIQEALARYLRQRRSAPSVGALTPRQREVLRLIADGKRTKEIARALGISVKTVEMHRGQLMKTLELRNVAELVRYAIRVGLIEA